MTHPLAPFARAVLEKAADRSKNRWAIRREHADKLAEMDYPDAVIDSKTVAAKADEAGSIADEIRALDADQIAAENAHLVPGVGEVERLREALVDQNDLLRSAMQIAKREGVDGKTATTNWDAFYNRVAVSLKRHHQTANEARAALQETRHD